jgi:peptide/nickel transport system substrate-binding protein
VTKAEIVAPNSVRFDLSGANDRELPLILGLMPGAAETRESIPTRSRRRPSHRRSAAVPYIVKEVKPGTSVTFVRNPDLLGRGPSDQSRLLEFRRDPLRLLSRRQFPISRRSAKVSTTCARNTIHHAGRPAMTARPLRFRQDCQGSVPTGLPKILSAFVFNTRRPIFADVRVREAIGLLFDADWANKNFFFGLYQRNAGYFDDSELSAVGRAADATERKLLSAFPGAVRGGHP